MMSRSDILIELQCMKGLPPEAARLSVKTGCAIEGLTDEWRNSEPTNSEWLDVLTALRSHDDCPKAVVNAMIAKFLIEEGDTDDGIQIAQRN